MNAIADGLSPGNASVVNGVLRVKVTVLPLPMLNPPILLTAIVLPAPLAVMVRVATLTLRLPYCVLAVPTSVIVPLLRTIPPVGMFWVRPFANLKVPAMVQLFAALLPSALSPLLP